MAKVEKLTVDEVIRRKGGDTITNHDEVLKQIDKLQDDRFTEFYSLRFGWKEQKSEDGKDPVKKLIAALPNGKICFLDRSQEEKDVISEDPYLCLVFDRPGSVAFAKILFPETQPRVYIPATRIPVMVWKDTKNITQRKRPEGDSYEERIANAVKGMELLGFESFKVIFRKNVRENLNG